MLRIIRLALLISFLFCTLLCPAVFAQENNPKALFKAYCGAEVLKDTFAGFGVKQNKADEILSGLISLADKSKGYNSMYELKEAANQAGLYSLAVKTDLSSLGYLLSKGIVIANFTGNRHFGIIKAVNENSISVYLPGINHPDFNISGDDLSDYWDNVVILISSKAVNLAELKCSYELVSDSTLKAIVGAQGCGNVSGGGGGYSGSGGSGRQSSGNEAGESKSESSEAREDAATKEPVVIRNGNLYLSVDDITIPTRGSLPLELKRYYNAQVVSEVTGWLPEPGAGSWVIEDGEYSGQGNRTTSDSILDDFEIELDMQTIRPGANHPWETAWVNIRYQENPDDRRKAWDCYYFLIHTNGTVELSKWKDGVQYWLYNKYVGCKATDKNHIKLSAQGTQIKIYINGKLEIDYTDNNDPLLEKGRVALESYFSHAHFDNVAITAADKNFDYTFDKDDNEFIFGYGWTHSYALRVKEYKTHVTLYRENNHKEIYVPNGDGTYFSFPVNYYAKLTKDDNGFSLRTKYGMHYRFNTIGLLTYVEDKNLNRTTLAYTVIGGKRRLSSIKEPTGRKITLEYGANNMVSKATDPAGNFLQYFYDDYGHLIKVIDRLANEANYSYDEITHNLTAFTDPEGNTYRYDYIYADRINTQVDPQGNTTTFDYLWSTIHVINSRGELYKYNFDNREFLQSILDPDEHIERTVNDENGNIVEYYDKNNNASAFTYDEQGNRTEVRDARYNTTTFTYEPVYNQPTSVTDARGNVTTFNYDDKGNLRERLDAEGATTKYTYNSYGRVRTMTDGRNNTTRYSYDKYGNLSKVTDALGNSTNYSYSLLGRLTSVTDALGHTQEYTCDNNGNLLSVQDTLGNTTAYAYTPNGSLASVTGPLGNTTNYTYDCFGNLLTVTDAKGNVTVYTYDTVNQMHLGRANLLSVTDAKGNTTTYGYDTLDRQIQQTDTLGRVYQFVYDQQGNLISRTDANSKITDYAYDELNRLVRIKYPDKSSVRYTLDEVGNLVYLQDASGATNYSYDKVNRLITQRYPDATQLNYSYDANGNQTTLEISGYGTISYSYDELNRLSSIIDPGSKEAQFSYDKISRRTKLTYPNGAVSSYVYDKANRLTQLLNKDKAATLLSKFIYSYDNASRRIRARLVNGAMNYTYDKANQLTKESGTIDEAAFSSVYSYDKAGNRKSRNEDGLVTSYVYNKLNQLTQHKNNSEGTVAYTYNKNGNLTRRILPSDTEKFSYDYENRLKGYTASGMAASYVYSGDGRRVKKTVNATATKYYYDGDELVLEKTGSDKIYYLRGPRIDELISDSRGYCYQTDGLGSVVSITDANGAQANSYVYKAFGELRSQSGSLANAWLYTGRQYDLENGLYFYRSRYYDARVGRFTTRDPIGYGGGINFYKYCSNNPVNRSDPFGLKPGDPYATQDDAARDAIGDINPTSISEGREYAGWTYQNQDGTYSYIAPNQGGKDWSNPGADPTGDKKGTAVYHTHGADDPGYKNEEFSRPHHPGGSSDITFAEERKVDIYLGTPNGKIKKYDPGTDTESTISNTKNNQHK